MEDGRRKTEDGGRRAEGGRRKAEDRGQKDGTNSITIEKDLYGL